MRHLRHSDPDPNWQPPVRQDELRCWAIEQASAVTGTGRTLDLVLNTAELAYQARQQQRDADRAAAPHCKAKP
jgi:hypothetical protein